MNNRRGAGDLEVGILEECPSLFLKAAINHFFLLEQLLSYKFTTFRTGMSEARSTTVYCLNNNYLCQWIQIMLHSYDAQLHAQNNARNHVITGIDLFTKTNKLVLMKLW